MSESPRYIFEFIQCIDIECPKCKKHAVVSSEKQGFNARLVCYSCGKSEIYSGNIGIYKSGQISSNSSYIVIGQPVDPYFKYPLWYQFDFKGRMFFAYNQDHLSFLKTYIADPLRKIDRTETGWANSSLQSRLPKWMLAANNRVALLKKIKVLESK